MSETPSTRQRMLGAALQRFALHGFEGAATREIAADAGVNQGLIRYHFESKEGLWRALVQEQLQALHEQLDARPLAISPYAARKELEWTLLRAADHPRLVCLILHQRAAGGARWRWLCSQHLDALGRRTLQRLQRAGVPAGAPTRAALQLGLGALTQAAGACQPEQLPLQLLRSALGWQLDAELGGEWSIAATRRRSAGEGQAHG